MDKKDVPYEREKMIQQQLIPRGIRDSAVLNAMRAVPREEFVPIEFKRDAYEDEPLPIEEGQTISQPYMVALMAEVLQLKPEDKVLEIGTGSGYAAAVLSKIVSHVYTIEFFPKLVSIAKSRYEKLGYSNIAVVHGDGCLGWLEKGPFQGISVTAGGAIPQALLEQLAIGGRLVMPVDFDDFFQELMLVTKKDKGNFTYEKLGPVRFVPLLGKTKSP